MPTEPKLEQYLTLLDKSLGQIPVSDRSEIVTEIKSHILEAQERDPSANVGQILASLGEPESVANRYLMERGLKPGKPSKSPIIKWLTIGFLGTFGIAAFTLVFLIWRFTPLIKIDENSGRVTILGGLIDVSEKSGSFHMGGMKIQPDLEPNEFNGSTAIDTKNFDRIEIPFNNGKFDINSAQDHFFRWNCKYQGAKNSAVASKDNRSFNLNLSNVAGVKCELSIPEGIALKIKGANGKIEVLSPQSPVDLNLGNGKVTITPDTNRKYRYDLKVSNGHSDSFVSSNDKDAIRIQVQVNNGSISQN